MNSKKRKDEAKNRHIKLHITKTIPNFATQKPEGAT